MSWSAPSGPLFSEKTREKGRKWRIGKSGAREGRREAVKGDSFASLLSFSSPSDPYVLEFSLPGCTCLIDLSPGFARFISTVERSLHAGYPVMDYHPIQRKQQYS